MVQFPRSSAVAALEREQRSSDKAKHDPNATLKAMLTFNPLTRQTNMDKIVTANPFRECLNLHLRVLYC